MDHIRVFYSDNQDVNPVDRRDYNDYLKNTEKKQVLEGFDPEYLDIVDYILKITHHIWEEKDIGAIYDTYHANVTIHTNAGSATGIVNSVNGTLATLYSFPDRRLMGEEVVWSQDNEDTYFSSHRIMSTATNRNDSSFGPATGKQASFRTIADCAVRENRVFEEWLMRDNLAIVKQLGFDPVEVAKKMAKTMENPQIAGLPETLDGQIMPARYQAKDDSLGEFFKEILQDIYNCKRIKRVEELFTDNCFVHTVGGEKLVGHDEIQGHIISLLSAFPTARYTIERITCNDQGRGRHTVAVRWRLRGLHQGLGMFGAPTGKAVSILGATQYVMEQGHCVEAFEVFDALDVLRQIVDVDQESGPVDN